MIVGDSNRVDDDEDDDEFGANDDYDCEVGEKIK
jgi:hypothetical protein